MMQFLSYPHLMLYAYVTANKYPFSAVLNGERVTVAHVNGSIVIKTQEML